LNCLKLEYDELLSNLASNLSLRLYGVFASRAAGKSMRDYFLGGNDVPWYMLGLSNASGGVQSTLIFVPVP